MIYGQVLEKSLPIVLKPTNKKLQIHQVPKAGKNSLKPGKNSLLIQKIRLDLDVRKDFLSTLRH